MGRRNSWESLKTCWPFLHSQPRRVFKQETDESTTVCSSYAVSKNKKAWGLEAGGAGRQSFQVWPSSKNKGKEKSSTGNPVGLSDSLGGKMEKEKTTPPSNSDWWLTHGHLPNLGCELAEGEVVSGSCLFGNAQGPLNWLLSAGRIMAALIWLKIMAWFG